MSDRASGTWLSSLRELTSSPEAASSWRERRYRFAYKLGSALVGPTDDRPTVHGPVIYGVWLDWGLLYVGQTVEAERRLRDLAVGESHHLANTFPPELWERVVVIAWGQLPEWRQVRLEIRECGLALEHCMQLWAKPLTNSSRRTADGRWRAVDWSRSASVGARAAAEVGPLFDRVQELWAMAERWTPGDPPLAEPVRCVQPRTLLSAVDGGS